MSQKIKESELLNVVAGKEPIFLDEVEGYGYLCPTCGNRILEKQDDNEWYCPGCKTHKKVFTLFIDSLSPDEPKNNLLQRLARVYDLEIETSRDNEIEEKLTSARDIAERGRKQAYMETFRAERNLDYFRTISDRKDGREIKTGFSFFDDENCNLFGGLNEGLYIIGAISSLGKTTFCWQLAEQIAERGTPVLFFSLEQSKEELLAKGISRRTYELGGREFGKGVQHILNSRKYASYSQKERSMIAEAIAKTAKADELIMIVEGTQNGKRIGIKEIKNFVREAEIYYGQSPVVFLDYLQILPPADVRAQERQNTDIAVTALKDISRFYHTPVIVISSFNRESYLEPVTMKAFKESGAIEYSSDVLMALQLDGMDIQKVKTGETFKPEDEKTRKARVYDLIEQCTEAKKEKVAVRVQLKVLKNRNGNTFNASLDLIHAYCRFEEIKELKSRNYRNGI